MLGDGGKVAFLFPGVDADFSPRVGDVARFFGRDVPLAGERLTGASSLERTGLGILMINRLLHGVLGERLSTIDSFCQEVLDWLAEQADQTDE